MSIEPDPIAGTVITLDENDYMYGRGKLRLRVGHVTALRSEPGWALVAGVQIDHRGKDRQYRDVVVRIRALRAAAQRCA
jgi:hypothetical protein